MKSSGLKDSLKQHVSLALLMVLCSASVEAYDHIITVQNNNDAGAGSLRAAIEAVNANYLLNPNSTNLINFTGVLAGGQTITALSNLPMIVGNVDIDASGSPNLIVSGGAGGGAGFSLFSVYQGNFSLANLTVQNGVATGGAGGNGFGPGGGALGAGGNLFAYEYVTSLSVNNVTFVGGNATSGAGGSATLVPAGANGGGGGGMWGGAGGAAGANGAAGGGGGFGPTATGGAGAIAANPGGPGLAGTFPLAGPGGNGANATTNGGVGGATAGGGGGGGYNANANLCGGGGGGGLNGGATYDTDGGAGGTFGGGGGAVHTGTGGSSQFGGGGGGSVTGVVGTSNFGGGSGANNQNGANSGSAFGGNVFTMVNLNIQGNTSFATGTVTPGAPGVGFGGNPNGTAGPANGEDLYLYAGTAATFDVVSGGTQTVGSTGNSIAGAGQLIKSGGGTLVLKGTNTYTGGTVVNAGVLQGDGNSLQGNITNYATVTFNNATANSAQNYNGVISNVGSVIIDGAASSAIIFTNSNTFTGLLNIMAGTAQLLPTVPANPVFAPDMPVTIGATGVLSLNSYPLTIGDLNGSGAVQLGAGSTFTFGTSTAATTFSGAISGTSNIVWQGTGHVTLSGNNAGFLGALTVGAGQVTLSGGGALGTFGGSISSVAAGATLEVNNMTIGGPITGGLAPTASTLLVSGPFTPTYPISNIKTITVSSGGNFALSGGNIPTGFSTINVNSGGTLSLTGGVNPNLTLSPTQSMVVAGTVNLTGGTIINTGQLTVNSGGVIGSTGNQTLENNLNGNINLAGGSITCPIFGQNTSSLTVSATSTTGNTITGIQTINVTGGTFNITQTVTDFKTLTIAAPAFVNLTTTLPMSPNSQLTANGVLTMGTGSTITGSPNSSLIINSNFTSSTPIQNVPVITVKGGTFTLSTVPTGFSTFTVGSAGTLLSQANFTLPLGASLIDSGTYTMGGFALTGNSSGEQFIVNGNFESTGQISNVTNITVGAGGTFTMSSVPTGFINFTTDALGTLSLASDFTVPLGSTVTNNGTITMNGYNILMGSNASLNSNGQLSTTGSIMSVSGGTGYSIVVGGGLMTVNNPISDYTNFQVTAGAVQLNPGGSILNSITLNGGTLIANGGTFSGDITGTGALTVTGAFAPTGNVTVGNLNVNNGGTFTVVNLTTVLTPGLLTVNSGGTLLLNNDIVGSITNNGAILNPQNVSRSITGDYIQSNTGTLIVPIVNSGETGVLNFSGTATIDGGNVIITLPNGAGNLTSGVPVSVLTTAGGFTVNALPTFSSPDSLLLSFEPRISGNVFQLVPDIGSVASEMKNQDPNLISLGSVIDGIRGKPIAGKFTDLFSIVDGKTNVEDLTTFLTQLEPEGRNLGVLTATCRAKDLSVDKILGRMSNFRSSGKTGYASGDMAEDQSSYGPFVFGSSMKQNIRNGLAGYTAATGGFGVLWDTPVRNQFRVGTAVSYAASSVRRDDITKDVTTINTVTGMVYGSADYGPLFMDSVISLSNNRYYGKRNVVDLGLTATSHYSGIQYGAKARGGFTLPYQGIEFSPMATVQYAFLNIGSYNEQNAPGVNLSVNQTRASELQMGLGGRLAEVSQAEEFLPEIHVLYLYDVKSPHVQMTSSFVDGGGSFVTNAPLPPKAGVNIGASITAKFGEDTIIVGGYDLEQRKSFLSHSFSFKFRWLF